MDDSTLKVLRVLNKANESLNLQPPFAKTIKEYHLYVGSDIDGVVIQAVPTESDGFAQVQKAGANGGKTS
jgi:hypothetical protein